MASALDSLTNPVDVVGVQPLTQASDVVANESSAQNSNGWSVVPEVGYLFEYDGTYYEYLGDGKWKNPRNGFGLNSEFMEILNNAYKTKVNESHGVFGSSVSNSNINSMTEREFSEYMTKYAHDLGLEADSTKYQRAYEDLLKTGLNPRLILDNAAASGVSASSAYNYSQSSNVSKSETESTSNSMSWSALIVGVLMLLGALVGA